MGSISHRQLTIAVHSPSGPLFNFHADSLTPAQPLSAPAFLKAQRTHNSSAVSYVRTSPLPDRLLEIHEIADDCTLRVSSVSTAALWRALSVDERVQLSEGDCIKMADVQLLVRKICRDYADMEGGEEYLRTLSDLEAGESVKLGPSRRLNRSKYDPNLPKIDSLCSLAENECRVCFGRNSSSRNPLLSLCHCAGSVKFIHYGCLRSWVTARAKKRSGHCFEYREYELRCDLCRTPIDRIVHHEGHAYPVFG